MATTLLGALALASVPSALAFRNTSPFFLFSTANLNINANDVEIARSTQVLAQVTNALESCPSRTYVVVRQEGVSSADYRNDDGLSWLGRYMSGYNSEVKSTLAVPEMLESADASVGVTEYLQNKCGVQVLEVKGAEISTTEAPARTASPLLIYVSMAAPPSGSLRPFNLNALDAQLKTVVENWADSQDYTVIYTTTPPASEQTKTAVENHHAYEMEDPFGEAVQMELKRDLSAHKRAASKQGGLFEKYQYFTPGLFMGLAAIAPLFLIIFVGTQALSSLEVSYFAFSKEMGPTAQKRQ